MEFRAIKGMNDILPDEARRFALVEAVFRRVVELHGFSEVRTPVLEPTELFVRSTGETSEIVEKQMFTLARETESFTLRPEGTPGVARAFLNGSVHAKEPVTRWYYIGAMFRAERPQRGRLRQFHQLGCEVYGDPGPVVDAEMIDMLVGLLAELGIADVEVRVNSIGGPGTRQKYRDALLAHLTPKKDSLSEHAQKRLLDNPLRILDSKDPRDREAVADAPSILDCSGARRSRPLGRLSRRARRARHEVRRHAGPGARPRLLHAHAVRAGVEPGRAGLAEHAAGRRSLRRHGARAGRSEAAGDRLRHRSRAAAARLARGGAGQGSRAASSRRWAPPA